MTNEFPVNEYQAAQQARAEVMNALSADDLAALGGAYNFEQAVIENDQFGNINYVTTDLHMDSQTGAMAPIRIAVPRALFIPPPGAETTDLKYTKLAVRRFARHAMIGAIHAANLMTGAGPGI